MLYYWKRASHHISLRWISYHVSQTQFMANKINSYCFAFNRSHYSHGHCDERVQSGWTNENAGNWWTHPFLPVEWQLSPSDKHTTSDSLFLISFINAEQPEKMVSAKKIRKNSDYCRSSMAISWKNVNSGAPDIVLTKTFYRKSWRYLDIFSVKCCDDFSG